MNLVLFHHLSHIHRYIYYTYVTSIRCIYNIVVITFAHPYANLISNIVWYTLNEVELFDMIALNLIVKNFENLFNANDVLLLLFTTFSLPLSFSSSHSLHFTCDTLLTNKTRFVIKLAKISISKLISNVDSCQIFGID